MTELTTPRRWIVGLSALGAANMTLGALRQFGVIRHLPDVSIRGFDSNFVITSGPAFVLGFPDAPLAVAGLAANIPLALLGGPDRARRVPWIPVMIAAKCVVEVSVAGWFLWQMKYRLHTWCAYCLLGASISTILAGLAANEARQALPARRTRLLGLAGMVLLGSATIGVLSLLEHRRTARC
jgi:uncharacterized membrane protein